MAGARDGSTPVLLPGSASSALDIIGGGNDGISITVTITSAERNGDITSTASTKTTDDDTRAGGADNDIYSSSAGGGGSNRTVAAGSGSGNAQQRKNPGRRRRVKSKPAVPVARAEAVELLRQAVTRFRAAQISSPASVSPSSALAGGGGGGGGASEGHAVLANAGGDSRIDKEAAAEKDPGTVAAEEFAEIAWRCLGSGLPEIALEVGLLFLFFFWFWFVTFVVS